MKRNLFRYALILVLLAACTFRPARADDWDHVDPDYKHASKKALEAWRDLKFGLRIHWGVYSIWAAGPESWPLTNHPREWQGRYCQLYRTWNPTGFDPDAWADLMARDGLKFFVFTTKHHDGFSMYDTRTTVKKRFVYSGPAAGTMEDCDLHYSIMETPFKRDVVRELIDAGRKRGIKPGLYFSHIDWYDADFRMDQWNPNRDKNYSPQTDPAAWARFVRRHREQIREILTKYGKISELSLDMNFPSFAWPDVKETIKMARRLQPDCLFRNRGIGAYGDYHTPENWIPDSPRSKESPLPWQVIHTLGRYMSYDPDGSAYKSGAWIVSNLIDIVAKGGLFMVGIGPDGNGKFHPKAIEALDYAGDWLKVNGAAIYATRPWTYWKEGDSVRFTCSKDRRTVYAICLTWPGETLRLKSIRPRPGSRITMLGVHKPLDWRMDANGELVIDIPAALQPESARPCKQAWAFRIEVDPSGAVTAADKTVHNRIAADSRMKTAWIRGILPMLIFCALAPEEPADSQSPASASAPHTSHLAPSVLPGTRPLTWTDDLSTRMVDGAHRYLDRKLADSIRSRGRYWRRDFSSRSAYENSVAPNRARLLAHLGATDDRVAAEMRLDPDPVAETPDYRVRAARWPVLAPVEPLDHQAAPERQSWPPIPGPRQVEGEGLLVTPTGKTRGYVVVLPDADQTPEQMVGLAPGVPPESQMARRLAENGYTVLIPTLIDRGHAFSHAAFSTDLPHREWIYRQGFEMGRTVIGYEVQKLRAAIDWFRTTGEPQAKVAVAGYGEGGLIAFYAAALDTRIDAVLVSGYFKPREHAWEEPLYRNVWGLLREFGDAEIATLIAPRPLVIEYSAEPDVVSSGVWVGPGRLETPPLEAVRAEFRRIEQLTPPGFQRRELVYGPNGDPVPFGSRAALEKLTALLGDPVELPLSRNLPADRRKEFRPETRQERQVKQLENDIQLSLQTAELTRERAFLDRMDMRSVAAFTRGVKAYRKRFEEEAIGKLNDPLLPMNPRTRRIYDEPTWTGYDVVLDVWPDVFAWGILCVPKDIRPGEKRPVVVCQHGLEGLPKDTIEPTDGYQSFAKRLVERGYVTFAPHNLYRGEVRFRLLQRKANLLKASLFSIITPQHEQILNFLQSLDFVDGSRIAFYGLSYGGKTAMRVPALLDRYCLSICSGDFNEWVRVNTTVHSGYSYLNRPAEWEMPEWDLGHTFNYAEMAALILPRPFMVERGHQDGVAPDDWVAYEYAKVRRLYDRLGIGDRTEIEFFDGPHTIHGVGTFAFLAKHLHWPRGERP